MNRIGFIGGSDMRRIMTGDWTSLWEEKTGRTEPEDLSDVLAVQLGSFTEQFNLDWFSIRHGCSIRNQQHTYEMNWNGVPLKGQIDGELFDSDDISTNEIVECKHTYQMNKMEACLEMYMPQIQFYLWISQAKGCYLSVIFGNNRWESVYVSKNWEYIEKMQVHLKEFWNLVRSDERPFGDDEVSPASIDKIKIDGMVKRDASGDNEFISRCHDYIEHQQSSALFESAKSDLKAMIGDNEREVYCHLLSIKRDKRGALRITVKENEDG